MEQASSVPVVIINGFGAPFFWPHVYAAFLRAEHLQTFVVPQQYLNYGDIRAASREVGRTVEQVCARTGAERVDLVGLSLGGLTGFYHVRCVDRGRRVRTLVSVGGPLKGSPLAYASVVPPLRCSRALCQMRPDSDVVREALAAPPPPGTRVVALGTRGDVLTPRALQEVEGVDFVGTPHGVFPFGHWMLFAHPGNRRVVIDLLKGS